MTEATMKALTGLQQTALGCIMDCGPCSAEEISRNWNIHHLGPALGGLEQRGLIGRDYTSQNYGPGKHGYYVTEEGREVCEALFGGDDV